MPDLEPHFWWGIGIGVAGSLTIWALAKWAKLRRRWQYAGSILTAGLMAGFMFWSLTENRAEYVFGVLVFTFVLGPIGLLQSDNRFGPDVWRWLTGRELKKREPEDFRQFWQKHWRNLRAEHAAEDERRKREANRPPPPPPRDDRGLRD